MSRPSELCALSFNIKVGVDSSPATIARDLLGAERALGTLHLCALQEVGRCWQMGVPVHQAAYLASCLRHQAHHFAPALTDDEGGQFGVAVTATYPLEGVQQRLLPRVVDEQRSLLSFTLSPEGWSRPLNVLTTHLSVSQEEREAQARVIADEVRRTEGPLLLLGDLNDLPNSLTLSTLIEAGLTDHWREHHGEALGYSFSVKQPNRRIDYLLSRGLTCLEIKLLTALKSSDHFPLWGRFMLSEGL